MGRESTFVATVRSEKVTQDTSIVKATLREFGSVTWSHLHLGHDRPVRHVLHRLWGTRMEEEYLWQRKN